MLEVVLFFLAASLCLYAVFGGADFGAGILELFGPRETAREQQALVARSIGPVWEANHVWLIVAVVILFTGFPLAFRLLSISFHLPLTLLLVGITMRGCAFTFRHYDAYQDESRKFYTAFFQASSLLTPLALGLVVGGILLGRATETGSYYDQYVAPWLHWFGFSIGGFLVCLFSFVAAVFLVGETEDAGLRTHYRRRAVVANVASVAAGALVFPAAHASGLNLFGRFVEHPGAVGAMAMATVLLVPLHIGLRKHARIFLTRVLASSIFGCVLVGWFALQYPILIATRTGGLTIEAAVAPEATLFWLGTALLVGCVFMFPALGYLFYVFKFKGQS